LSLKDLESMSSFQEVITWMDWITIVFAFFAMLGAGVNWWNNKKQLQKITIYFNDKKLNLDITRKDVTRQELQGILGILRKNMKTNYHVEYLSNIEYLDKIYQIQKCKKDALVIIITDKESKQFRDDIYTKEE